MGEGRAMQEIAEDAVSDRCTGMCEYRGKHEPMNGRVEQCTTPGMEEVE